MYIAPSQGAKLGDAKAGIHRRVDHRGVGFDDQINELLELLRGAVRFDSFLAALLWWQLYTLHRIPDRQPVGNGAFENARKEIADLVFGLVWR